LSDSYPSVFMERNAIIPREFDQTGDVLAPSKPSMVAF